jgi:hypothetical protein
MRALGPPSENIVCYHQAALGIPRTRGFHIIFASILASFMSMGLLLLVNIDYIGLR